MSRVCACGRISLPYIPKGTISTIIPDSHGFEVGDYVNIFEFRFQIDKVTTSGTAWFYHIGTAVYSEHELCQHGNKPTRTFYWESPEPIPDEDILIHLKALREIFEGPGFKLQNCTIPLRECPWKKEHALYNAILALLEVL